MGIAWSILPNGPTLFSLIPRQPEAVERSTSFLAHQPVWGKAGLHPGNVEDQESKELDSEANSYHLASDTG